MRIKNLFINGIVGVSQCMYFPGTKKSPQSHCQVSHHYLSVLRLGEPADFFNEQVNGGSNQLADKLRFERKA